MSFFKKLRRLNLFFFLQTNHAEEEETYRRSGGRKERFRERPNKKSAGGPSSRAPDFPVRPVIKQRDREEKGAKSRGKDAQANHEVRPPASRLDGGRKDGKFPVISQ